MSPLLLLPAILLIGLNDDDDSGDDDDNNHADNDDDGRQEPTFLLVSLDSDFGGLDSMGTYSSLFILTFMSQEAHL